jgi:hypothetical protein
MIEDLFIHPADLNMLRVQLLSQPSPEGRADWQCTRRSEGRPGHPLAQCRAGPAAPVHLRRQPIRMSKTAHMPVPPPTRRQPDHRPRLIARGTGPSCLLFLFVL